MKRFSFRLQKLLDIREQIRDELRQELVRKNQQRDHELHVLAELEQESLRAMIEEGGTYSASDLVMFGDYRARLKRRIEEQRQRVVIASKEAEEAKERYVEASKEAKALELLRQRERQSIPNRCSKKRGRSSTSLRFSAPRRERKKGFDHG